MDVVFILKTKKKKNVLCSIKIVREKSRRKTGISKVLTPIESTKNSRLIKRRDSLESEGEPNGTGKALCPSDSATGLMNTSVINALSSTTANGVFFF